METENDESVDRIEENDIVFHISEDQSKPRNDESVKDKSFLSSSDVNQQHMTDDDVDARHSPNLNVDISSIEIGFDKDDEDSSPTFKLPPEFLQRSPSTYTIANMTMPKYNTIPKSKSETVKKLLNQSNQAVSTEKFNQNVKRNDKGAKNNNDTRANEDTWVTQENSETSVEDNTKFIAKGDDKNDQTTSLWENMQKEPISENLTDSVCMECIKAIQVFSRKDIRPGDHISFSGRIYDHHAIVVGICEYESESNVNEAHIEVVHATNTAAKAAFAIFHPFGNKARLRQVNMIINFKDSKVMVFKYSDTIKPFSRSKIVTRAREEAKADKEGKDSKYKYDLFQNNCEHFVTWCVTGKKLSLQVRKFTMVFKMFFNSGLYDISDERARNEKEYENGMLCKRCYNRNKRSLDIPHKLIDKTDDVNAGDIIVYSYYFLWHNAVVLRKIRSKKNYIKCEIAHYAYLGPFKHHTIIKENLLIPLDGTVMVLRYPKDKFDLHDDKEVVKRAESRIGEQMFAYFTNDSCQFSRWCKLKLQKERRTSNIPS